MVTYQFDRIGTYFHHKLLTPYDFSISGQQSKVALFVINKCIKMILLAKQNCS